MSEHVEQLEKAREQLVKERRLIAKTLAAGFRRDATTLEDCEKFNQLQSTIEAIYMAIEDERSIAGEEPED
jgi:hypothetical protein